MLLVGLQQAVTVGLAAQGELLTEKSGILNIGIEGTMLLSAFAAAYFNWYFDKTLGVWSSVAGLAAGVGTGMLSNFVFSSLSTRLHVDQVIAGIGINIFAGGITVVALIVDFGNFDISPLAYKLPALFTIRAFSTNWLISPLEVMLFVLPALMFLLLNRTKFGLHVRAVGENPKAAEAAGLNVAMTRILATTLGGALLGMSGAYLSVGLSAYFTKGMTRGLGFIALAAVIAGAWNPAWVLAVSVMFGLSWGIFIQFGGSTVLGGGQGVTYFLAAFPYIITVVVLALASKRLRPPSALALPYKKE